VGWQSGEITIDQAHRGYTMAADGWGFKSVNPLFMKYTPSNGMFSGQKGYGKSVGRWKIIPLLCVRYDAVVTTFSMGQYSSSPKHHLLTRLCEL